MKTNHAHIAQLALEQYGLGDARRTLSQDLFNTTYCITDTTGQKYNLRLCGADLQNSRRVQDELIFIDFLAQRNQIRVPKPVHNLDGEFVTRIAATEDPATHSRICCLFEWIEGEVLRDHLSEPLLYQMGSATAQLHLAAKAFRFPTPEEPFRADYNYDEAVVLQHREWLTERQAEISSERVELINRAIDQVLGQLVHFPKNRDTYGFIHADLNPNNFIVTNPGGKNEEVSVIDFEQLGRGHFCFDLATTMVDLDERKTDFARRWFSFKQGYQKVTELPFEDERELEPFVMTVHLNFLDWLYNTPTPHVREQFEARFHEVHELIRNGLETEQ